MRVPYCSILLRWPKKCCILLGTQCGLAKARRWQTADKYQTVEDSSKVAGRGRSIVRDRGHASYE